MNAIDAMVLDIDVARNRREVAAGFAALRAELVPPVVERPERGWMRALRAERAAYAQAQMAARDPWGHSLSQMQAAAPDPNPYRFGHGLAHNAFGW